MQTTRSTTRVIILGAFTAVALLIAAVWASDASLATSLALTGAIVLVAVGALISVVPIELPRDSSDDQRDRMKQTTP